MRERDIESEPSPRLLRVAVLNAGHPAQHPRRAGVSVSWTLAQSGGLDMAIVRPWA